MSTAYGRRASELVPIPADDDWTAYQFDSAVLTFGRWVENRLAERDGKGRPKYRIEELLRDPAAGPGAGAKPVRESVAAKRAPIRKVRIPQSGTW